MAINQKRVIEAVKILKDYDSQGKNFAAVKNHLLSKGYSQKEILFAVYTFPYDGKPDKQTAQTPLTKLFEEHPEQAQSYADAVLESMNQHERIETYSLIASSSLPGPVGLKSQLQLAEKLNLKYYWVGVLLILILQLAALLVDKGIQSVFELIILVLITGMQIYFFYKLVVYMALKRRTMKMVRQSRETKNP